MDLFILPSGKEMADVEATIDSFNNCVPVEVRFVDSLSDIAEAEIIDEWYMILYDDEVIEPKLCEVLPEYLQSDFKMIECFKKHDDEGKEFSFSPRLFKNNVRPQPDTLLPANIKELNITRILDGWIKSNAEF